MATDLFQKCELCKGRCQIPDPRDGAKDPQYVECPMCGSEGFTHVGVTLGQVDRWACVERWLAGDPTLAQAEAEEAEAFVWDRLSRLPWDRLMRMREDALCRRSNERKPAGKCERCGAVWYFRGSFSAALFSRQAQAFALAHQDCPLAVNGGGI